VVARFLQEDNTWDEARTERWGASVHERLDGRRRYARTRGSHVGKATVLEKGSRHEGQDAHTDDSVGDAQQRRERKNARLKA
jgi:hypothetical protein